MRNERREPALMKSICFVRSERFVTLFFYLNKLLAENLSSVSALTKGEVYLSQSLFSLPVSIYFSISLPGISCSHPFNLAVHGPARLCCGVGSG